MRVPTEKAGSRLIKGLMPRAGESADPNGISSFFVVNLCGSKSGFQMPLMTGKNSCPVPHKGEKNEQKTGDIRHTRSVLLRSDDHRTRDPELFCHLKDLPEASPSPEHFLRCFAHGSSLFLRLLFSYAESGKNGIQQPLVRSVPRNFAQGLLRSLQVRCRHVRRKQVQCPLRVLQM